MRHTSENYNKISSILRAYDRNILDVSNGIAQQIVEDAETVEQAVSEILAEIEYKEA